MNYYSPLLEFWRDGAGSRSWLRPLQSLTGLLASVLSRSAMQDVLSQKGFRQSKKANLVPVSRDFLVSRPFVGRESPLFLGLAMARMTAVFIYIGYIKGLKRVYKGYINGL